MSASPSTSTAGSPAAGNTGAPPDRRCLSNILPINLDDSPASGLGRFSTVGVLEPAIRIERSAALDPSSSSSESEGEGTYRIIASCVLEVAIVGFDQSFQRYNRFFDAIALRYLFCRGDQVGLRPRSDAAVQGLHVTRERNTTSAANAGVAPGGVSVAAPQVSVQAQRDFKVAYQRTMSSWRTGLSFTEYPSSEARPPLSARLAAHMIPKTQQRAQQQQQQQPCFSVGSPHAPACRCPHGRAAAAPPPCMNKRHYDRAALWSWQTEAALRLWTPEIYGSFRCPITVMREVPVGIIDALPNDDQPSSLQPYLHFDFEVRVQLRVLGLGLASLVADAFRPTGSRPAELRLQAGTTGQRLLPPDHLRFCIGIGCCCCSDDDDAISWPLYPTRNLQDEAELGTLGPDNVAHRLQTNAEFSAALDALHRPVPVHKNMSTHATDTVAPPQAKTIAVSHGDPLALPAIVPASARASHAGSGGGSGGGGGAAAAAAVQQPPCRCQSLRPTQNRLYHCSMDCPAGHAYKATRRRPAPSEKKS